VDDRFRSDVLVQQVVSVEHAESGANADHPAIQRLAAAKSNCDDQRLTGEQSAVSRPQQP
jgi:hypothetical protein